MKGSSMTNPSDNQPNGPFSQGYGQGGHDQSGYGQPGSQGYGQGGHDQSGYGQPASQSYGPGSYGAFGAQSAPADGKPQNFMAPSVFATIGGFVFCCLLGLATGIAALVFANKVDTLWNMGDYQGAQAASDKAKLWMNITVILAVIGLFVSIILISTGQAHFYFHVN